MGQKHRHSMQIPLFILTKTTKVSSNELKATGSNTEYCKSRIVRMHLFSYILYAAASVQTWIAYEKFKASQRICSGQRLYENFMRTKGRKVRKVPDKQKFSTYEIFWIYSTVILEILVIANKFSKLTILAFHKLLIFITWSISQYILILENYLVSY